MGKTFDVSDVFIVAKRLLKNGFKENLTNSVGSNPYKEDLITLVGLFENFIAENEGANAPNN